MFLYGREWTRRELEARVGRMDQIGGVQKFRMEEGPESGVELIQVRTGSGLCYYVNPYHAMDISLAEFMGVPLSWHAVNGEVHPSYYNPQGAEWLRTAAGGLLMTCGLSNVGSPCKDGGEELGQHGRLHHTPARQVVAESNWSGDEYEMRIRGIVEENRIFGENLRLTREIRGILGRNLIIISDVVENIGFTETPLMILYHFNFGFPLISENTRIKFPSQKVTPRDQHTPQQGYDQFPEPEVACQEHVYYHQDFETAPSANATRSMASVVIENPHFPVDMKNGGLPLAVRLSWDADTLPKLIEWKMPAAGVYALGIEPANCLVEGRAAERERGSLVQLRPGGSINFFLELEIIY